MHTIEGTLEGAHLRLAIVASRFDKAAVLDRLIAGAVEAARGCSVPDGALDLVRVPGAFELAAAARRLAASGRYDAIVCVGAVVRGETPHFEYIAREAARGIAAASHDFDLPVTFGVITADTVEQARERADGKSGNKGREAMLAAIEMATLFARLPGPIGVNKP
ncbi:MAG: 6,7-dimethyl-8-ribityllumazine synthase [Dehalococcoidia bacterium]|nr:6,7-dimethyl-8-ribityllumazine synthase [Dehalococcoidia bacterium]